MASAITANRAVSPPDIVPLVGLSIVDVLALNNAHAQHTSWLDEDRLMAMLRMAFYARGMTHATAMLIAFDQDAAYDSPNFLWHRAHYRRFIYIDRVITAAAMRGRGYARALYQDLFVEAAQSAHELVACEVNLDPPNPVSDAFHAALAFAEVGRAVLESGKTVRYLVRPVGPPPGTG